MNIEIGLAQEAFGHIDDIIAGFNDGSHQNFSPQFTIQVQHPDD